MDSTLSLPTIPLQTFLLFPPSPLNISLPPSPFLNPNSLFQFFLLAFLPPSINLYRALLLIPIPMTPHNIAQGKGRSWPRSSMQTGSGHPIALLLQESRPDSTGLVFLLSFEASERRADGISEVVPP